MPRVTKAAVAKKAPKVKTPEVKTETIAPEVKKAESKLAASYLRTLQLVADLGGKEGKEVSRVAIQGQTRSLGVSDAAVDTHLYRMRSGRAGTPVVLANDKSGAASNLNERFIILPSGFEALGIKCPTGHPEKHYNVVDGRVAQGASEPGKSYTVK